MAFEGLPEELMTLILVKLPVKSLLRFKCVRKSWYSLIKSPQFIRLHRSSSSSSSPRFIIREEEPRHILSSYSYETLDDLGNDIDIPISYKDHSVSLSGSCDGLVCIIGHHLSHDDNDKILICNPAIRELRLLSAPPSPVCLIYSVAFGSDPSTGQYKVLIIGVRNGRRDCEAHLYDFRSDSWRETGFAIRAPFDYSHPAISLNGAFHWCPTNWGPKISFDGFQRDYSNILTFRFSDEVTGSIPLPDLPDFLDEHRSDNLCVISSKSQLSLIVHDFYWSGRFEICVMTEYGVKESWIRLFKIGPLLDMYAGLVFWDEQQLLLRTKEGRQLVSCDHQHQNLRYFPICGGFDVDSYSESLVSVNGIVE